MQIKSLKTKIILLFLGTIVSISILTAIILFVVSLRIFEQQMDDGMDAVAGIINNNIDTLNKEINGIAVRFSLNSPGPHPADCIQQPSLFTSNRLSGYS